MYRRVYKRGAIGVHKSSERYRRVERGTEESREVQKSGRRYRRVERGTEESMRAMEEFTVEQEDRRVYEIIYRGIEEYIKTTQESTKDTIDSTELQKKTPQNKNKKSNSRNTFLARKT